MPLLRTIVRRMRARLHASGRVAPRRYPLGLAAGAAALLLAVLGAARGDAASIRYVYDSLGRLIGVVDPSGNAAAYEYDAVGNLLSISRHAAGAVSVVGFTPSTGPAGSAVTIVGTGFSPTPAQNTVRFNGAPAQVVSATATDLLVTVPAGASTGPISVTSALGSATSALAFTVAAGPPSIAGFAPNIGTPGTAVTISGANFDAVAPSNRVTFNGLRSSPVDTATATTLGTTVPSGVGSGRIAVSTVLGSAVSAQDFFIPPAPFGAADVDATGRLVGASPLTVSISTPGRIGLVVFDATADQRAVLTLSACTIASGQVTVLAPDGSMVSALFMTPAGSSANLVLSQAGTHAVLLNPDGANTGSVTLSLATADLVVTSLTAPDAVNTQQTIDVTWTVRNQGTATAGGLWADQLLLSSSPVCCAGAQTLGTFNFATPVAPGGSYTATRTVTIPKIAPGSYYLLLSTDATGLLYEAAEANNVLARPLAVRAPDIVVDALTAPASVATQQSVDVSWALRNAGTGPLGGLFADALFLSPTPTCCAGATALGTWNISPTIPVGGTFTQTRTVTIPRVPGGSYYLVVSTDHTNLVHEANEANNQLSRPISIGAPDLAPSAITVPYVARAGQSVSVSWTVLNQGAGAGIGLWTDSVYLSPDETCCAGATLLGSINVSPAVASKKTYGASQTVHIPNVAPGVYYVIVKADSSNLLYEANESNNERSRVILILRP